MAFPVPQHTVDQAYLHYSGIVHIAYGAQRINDPISKSTPVNTYLQHRYYFSSQTLRLYIAQLRVRYLLLTLGYHMSHVCKKEDSPHTRQDLAYINRLLSVITPFLMPTQFGERQIR